MIKKRIRDFRRVKRALFGFCQKVRFPSFLATFEGFWPKRVKIALFLDVVFRGPKVPNRVFSMLRKNEFACIVSGTLFGGRAILCKKKSGKPLMLFLYPKNDPFFWWKILPYQKERFSHFLSKMTHFTPKMATFQKPSKKVTLGSGFWIGDFSFASTFLEALFLFFTFSFFAFFPSRRFHPGFSWAKVRKVTKMSEKCYFSSKRPKNGPFCCFCDYCILIPPVKTR